MERFKEFNYYDLLELKPTATPDEIRRSYEIVKRTYSEDSIATYSLMDPETKMKFMELVEKAFSVLSDEVQKREYDLRIGVAVPVPQNTEADPVLFHHSETEMSPDRPMPSHVAVPTPVSVDGNDTPPQQINGPVLKKLREHRGIPLQEIAAKTRISILYLQYIEQDYFPGLPAEVYLRGYLFQYVKAVGLDPNPVVEKYFSHYRSWKSSNPAAG